MSAITLTPTRAVAGSLPGQPFVGRHEERRLIERSLTQLRRGAARVIEIVGEPGIGKTRLIAELCERAGQGGQRVLVVRTLGPERQTPPVTVIEAVGDGSVAPLDPRSLERLDAELVDSLAAIFPSLLTPRTNADGAPMVKQRVERHRLHRAVRMLLEELAVPPGLVLVFDDVHEADEASVELITHLLRYPPRAGVLVALAYRPRQVSARLAAALAVAGWDGLVERLELGPLTVEEVDELLGSGVGRLQRRVLHQASGGNPFYLEALASACGEAAYSLKCGDTGALGSVPSVVQEVVRDEFDALSATGRLVAQVAAVVGDPFEPELVAEVVGLEEAETLAVIDELLGRDLVRPVGSSRRFSYRHPLLRNAVYEAADAQWRRTAHARAAAALETRNDSTVARARHVERTAEVGDETAIAVLVEAASATMPWAPSDAAHWLQAAARLLPEQEKDALRRLELLVESAKALGLAGRLRDSRDLLHEVLSLLPAEAAERRAEAAALYAMAQRLLGRCVEGSALLRDGLAARSEAKSRAAATITLGLVSGNLLAGDFDTDRAWAQEALRTANRHRDQPLHAAALAALALTGCVTGDLDQAAFYTAEAGRTVDALIDGELARRPATVVWLGLSELLLERYDDALRHLARGLELARDSDQTAVLPHLLVGLSMVQRRLGRMPEASASADDAVEAALLLGSDAVRTMALTGRCAVATAAGDLEVALRAGEQAVEAAGSAEDLWAAYARATLGVARLAAGDARGCVATIVEGGRGPELPAIPSLLRPELYEVLVRAELVGGNVEAAERWADRAEAAGGATGFALLARARALLARQRKGAAARALAAVTAFRQAGNRIEAGRAHLLAAAALAAAGERAAALDEASRAEIVFHTCGARQLHDQAVTEQRRLEPQALQGKGLLALSSRELEVAKLVGKGHTNQQIARKLSVSHKTIETHLSRTFTKLGVSSRAAVATAVAEAGRATRPVIRCPSFEGSVNPRAARRRSG